jgi:hypothetical protein
VKIILLSKLLILLRNSKQDVWIPHTQLNTYQLRENGEREEKAFKVNYFISRKN